MNIGNAGGATERPSRSPYRIAAEVDRVFTAHDGRLFHRGVYLERDVAQRLLPILEADPIHAEIAAQLREAMEIAA